MAIRESRVSYAGFATRQLTVEGAGPGIILLHGFGHPADCWRPVLARLAKAGQSALAVDLPGFGAADTLRTGPLLPQLDEFVADLVTTVAGRDSVVLVGNSLGAAASVRAAGRGRGLPIRALLPIGVAGFGWTRLGTAFTKCNSAPLRLLAGVPVPAAIRRPVAYQVCRRLLYVNLRNADPALVRLLSAQMDSRRDGRRVIRLGSGFAAEVDGSAAGLIDCATTVVHGRRDRIVSLAASRRLHREIPGSRLVVLDDAGHCPQLDVPAGVASLVLELARDSKNRSA